jgi:hypothetical protein
LLKIIPPLSQYSLTFALQQNLLAMSQHNHTRDQVKRTRRPTINAWHLPVIRTFLWAGALVLTFIFCLPQSLPAQYGIRIGTTVSSFYYPGELPDPYKEYDIDLRPYVGYDIEWLQIQAQKPLASIYISAYRSFALRPRLTLRPELSFSQKGVNFSQYDYQRSVYKVKISYLELPLSLAYTFRQKERSSADIYLGGYGAFRLHANKKVAAHHSPVENTKLYSVKDFDGGFHLGGSYCHAFKDDFLLLDFRIFLELNDIFELPENWTSLYFSTHQTRLTGLHLSVGYEF